ncbi:A24 family peptidase [Tsuneonella mangrovi]|uniref:A24 family peptidase n=1 Tax=Tsuneonella mangrovi TaxID=1982042 RepID=UPI000BA23702|nr:prepilin peptidase [Tsuneonella mangrovi]
MLQYLHYGLLAALAIALLFAAFTDWRRRQIDNWLNAAIALTAPLFWWSSGLTLWPGVALQLAMAVAAFVVFATLFALKWMGGGDVKLLVALALWFPATDHAYLSLDRTYPYLQLLVIMAVLGGVLTLVMGAWHIARRQKHRLAIPYGLAIAAAGLWVLSDQYLPAARSALIG